MSSRPRAVADVGQPADTCAAAERPLMDEAGRGPVEDGRPSVPAPARVRAPLSAWSSAMRQLFQELAAPSSCPRSAASQLSRGETLPRAAAMPPSAMTVCALPSSDLHTTRKRAPPAPAAADGGPACRRPPAPITRTVGVDGLVRDVRPSQLQATCGTAARAQQSDVEVDGPHREHAEARPHRSCPDVEHGPRPSTGGGRAAGWRLKAVEAPRRRGWRKGVDKPNV